MYACMYVLLNFKLDLASVDQPVIWSTGGVLYTCVTILITHERSRDLTRCGGIRVGLGRNKYLSAVETIQTMSYSHRHRERHRKEGSVLFISLNEHILL